MSILSLYIADVDDAFVINAMRSLENSPIRVIGHAGDGRTALKQIDDLHPNVLLANTHLPMLDGIDLIHRSCSMKRPPVCIASTRFYSDVVLDAVLTNGAVYCLYKPISYEYLPRVITNCWECARRRAAQETYAADAKSDGGIARVSVTRLRELLDSLGFPIRMHGSLYVVEAMLQLKQDPTLLQNLSKGLYAVLAEKLHSSPAAVERCLRNAVASSYARGNLSRVFDRRPSNRVFLEYLLRQVNAGLRLPEDISPCSPEPGYTSKYRELLL